MLRGDATRRAILQRAADIASVDGLDGLSIGRLATELGVSKSGVFAHFGAKEELQLATIRFAARIFADRVVEPALAQPPGLMRLLTLLDRWLSYSRERAFPGGCFFAAVTAEYRARPGRVHDELVDVRRNWIGFLAQTISDARQLGELTGEADPEQLAFECDALARAANADALLCGDDAVYERASAAIRARVRPLAR